MKSKCKTCGANSDSEYCFRHKPRKALSKLVKNASFDKGAKLKKSSFLHQKLDKSDEEIRKISELQQFFLQIWRKMLPYSEVSMDYLGSEPLTVFFHHILPKEKYPEAMFDEENIILLTLEEHDAVEKDMYKYEEVNLRREKLKSKYDETRNLSRS
jgi:hypothetical protein